MTEVKLIIEDNIDIAEIVRCEAIAAVSLAEILKVTPHQDRDVLRQHDEIFLPGPHPIHAGQNAL